MLAEKNEAIDDAATTVYQLSEDERIRLQCQAREDYERDQRTVQHYIEMQAKALNEKQQEIQKLRALLKANGIDAGDLL